jgi:hypothetical protein
VLATADIRKVSIAMAIIIAMITVLLPLCMMAACGMGATEMMGSPALGLSGDCVNVMTSGAQAAISPGSPLSAILLLLTAAVGVAFALAVPPLATQGVRVVAEDPPAPPDDRRGVRLII